MPCKSHSFFKLKLHYFYLWKNIPKKNDLKSGNDQNKKNKIKSLGFAEVWTLCTQEPKSLQDKRTQYVQTRKYKYKQENHVKDERQIYTN